MSQPEVTASITAAPAINSLAGAASGVGAVHAPNAASAAKVKRVAASSAASATASDLRFTQRIFSLASVVFVALLAASEFLPNVTSANPQSTYLYVVAAAVWAAQLFACLLARTKQARNSATDLAAVVLVLLLVWLVVTAKTGFLPEKMFPAPGIVFAQIVSDWAKIVSGVASSLSIVAEGFVLGGVSALVLGLVLGFNARSNATTEKVVSFLAAIPPIVYIPYGIALLPTFRSCSVMVIFLATFWPVLTGTLAGVNSVDARAIDSARVLNVKLPTMLSRVVLPGALPLIFNGANIGLTLSFILLTSAEMIGGNSGMGYYVKYYSDFGDYTRILAGIIVIGVVITVVSLLFTKLQKRLTRWR